MLEVIRRGGPANAKQSQGVEEGNRLEKLETWEGRRVPTFALVASKGPFGEVTAPKYYGYCRD